jgi:hypothetical protein
LPPTRHTPIYESRVAFEADLRAEPEAFGHAWPEPLNENVAPLDQVENKVSSTRLLEVDGNRPPPTV